MGNHQSRRTFYGLDGASGKIAAKLGGIFPGAEQIVFTIQGGASGNDDKGNKDDKGDKQGNDNHNNDNNQSNDKKGSDK